jgi:hypothetical protein
MDDVLKQALLLADPATFFKTQTQPVALFGPESDDKPTLVSEDDEDTAVSQNLS